MARNYAALMHDYLTEMEDLSDEEFGRLCRALLRYSMDGTPITGEGNERWFAKVVMHQEDRFQEGYNRKATASIENGKKGGRPKKATAPEKPNENSEIPETQQDAEETKETHETRQVSLVTEENPENPNAQSNKNKSKQNKGSKNNSNQDNAPDGAAAGVEAIALTERFEAFWKIYPRKVGKQEAWKAWKKIRPGKELSEKINSAVEAQKKWDQWTKDGGQFIPHPATWLNQGRWEDEAMNIPRSGSGGKVDRLQQMSGW